MPTQPLPFPPAAASRRAAAPRGARTLGWGLPLLALLVVCGLWAVLLGLLEPEAERIERDASARASGLARAYQEYAERSIEQIDQLTRFVAYSWQRNDADIDLTAMVRAQLANQSGLYVLNIIDAQGHFIASTQPGAVGGNVADRAYFQRHAREPGLEMQISTPIVGRLTGRNVLVFSRRLSTDEGRFAGVVAVSADPAYFADFYREETFGERGVLALQGDDQRLRTHRLGSTVRFDGPIEPLPPPATAPRAPATAASACSRRRTCNAIRCRCWSGWTGRRCWSRSRSAGACC